MRAAIRSPQLLRAILLLQALLLCAACASRGVSAVARPAETPGPLPRLAAPRELPQRVPAFTEDGLRRSGGDFEPGLPRQLATMAYAGYVFGLEDYDREPDLRLAWATAPAPDRAWIAVANFVAADEFGYLATVRVTDNEGSQAINFLIVNVN